MSGSIVSVSIQLDRAGRRVEAAIEMPIWIVERALVKLDSPKDSSHGITRFLCSDAATVRDTMKARLDIAKPLLKALLDAMGAQDTECGYPKEQS